MDTLEERSPHSQEDGLEVSFEKRVRSVNFRNGEERETHLQLFFEWLPSSLQTAPGIEWKRLPSPVMGYLISTVGDSPDAIPIALAVGSAIDGMRKQTLLSYCQSLAQLLRRLRHQYGFQEFAELGSRDIWDRFVDKRVLSSGEVRRLQCYDSFATNHLRHFLEGLSFRERTFWEPYVLPPLPVGFIFKQANRRAVEAEVKKKRKEQSDVLYPLFPLLVELVQLRKQAAERLIKEFRKQRDRAISGEITPPYHFQYADRQFAVSGDASTLAEVTLIERAITYSFTLWDRESWVQEHPERYEHATRKRLRNHRDAYAPDRALYFLQFHGVPKDLLWIGDLIANWRLGDAPSGISQTSYLSVRRPGLLTPPSSDSKWLSCARISGEMLFEPESLYRAILFGAALATLALTNGSRVSELLQVSADRFETLVVDELKNQQPTGRKIGILVQNLLPKGSTQEHERQFFLIGEMAGRLLTEIGQMLEATHGGTIPIVHPYDNTKAEDLQPEPYLFQWAPSADGRMGLLTAGDVGTLLRLLFHGLTLTTRTGTPIRVATHLLRHVLATHARQAMEIPAEAVAYLLHHRVHLSDSTRTLTISEATAYYSCMTLEQLLALLFEAQSALTMKRDRSYLQVPPPRTLEQMDEALRKVFEQWGMLGPTVLGYCSAGLCIRPNNRALCLNCPHLVPHYSNLRNAKIWRRFHVLQAQLHDAHGHYRDAQQARQMVQYLDDIIRIMEIQIRTRQDGGYLPFADTLLQKPDEEEEHDDGSH